MICVVKALVEATPISGPACVYSTSSLSRAIVASRTLQIEITREPLSFAWRSAASVSAVSPDCETGITRQPGPRIGPR